MKKMLVALMMLCSVMTYGALTVENSGARPGVWTTDYEAALKGAKADNGIVFLMFTGSDWCGWCKLMEKQVFSQSAWSVFAAKKWMYLVFIDFPRDRSKMSKELQEANKKLQEEYQVQGFPTMFLMDGNKKRFGQLSASREVTVDSFIQQTQEALFFSPRHLEEVYQTLPKDVVAKIRQAKTDDMRRVQLVQALLNKRFPEDGKRFQNLLTQAEKAMGVMQDMFAKAQNEAKEQGKEMDWDAVAAKIRAYYEKTAKPLQVEMKKLSAKVIQ